MGFFRRHEKETLNERLLHEAGLDNATEAPEPEHADPEHAEPEHPESEQPEPVDPFAGTYPATDVLGIWHRAMARPGEFAPVMQAARG